jgi:hypothetical protein
MGFMGLESSSSAIGGIIGILAIFSKNHFPRCLRKGIKGAPLGFPRFRRHPAQNPCSFRPPPKAACPRRYKSHHGHRCPLAPGGARGRRGSNGRIPPKSARICLRAIIPRSPGGWAKGRP